MQGFPLGSFPPQATAPTNNNNNSRAPSSRSPTPENHSSRSPTPEENRPNISENDKSSKDDRYKERYRYIYKIRNINENIIILLKR
jgi:hypothetical protein